MKLILQRYSDNGDSTQGLLFMLNAEGGRLDFESYTLEDESRAIKIFGETCISAGLYEVKFRKVLSGKTLNYQKKYPWFRWHLELQDVPDFKFVYIHIGNDDDDSNGCILVQDGANNNQVNKGFNPNSLPAFKRLYLEVNDALQNDEKVFIRIRDIKELA